MHVENATTGCYNTVSLTLIVNELPVLIQPLPLELCDDNNTGDEVEEFTLEDSIEQVLDGMVKNGNFTKLTSVFQKWPNLKKSDLRKIVLILQNFHRYFKNVQV